MKKVNVYTACINASGEADLVHNVVECTQEQYERGEHYYLAEDLVIEDGYEGLNGNFISYDDHEVKNLLRTIQFFNKEDTI